MDLVNLQNHGKDISQMVWGAIWIGGRSELVIMERDDQSPRNGYSTNSYIAALEQGLVPVYEPGKVFQQDNARIHVSGGMQEWFERHGIWVPEWPPHSPDLNPIEHVWGKMKLKIMELYPQIREAGRSQVDWTQFKEALQHAWWSIPQDYIDNLIYSMPRRLGAVRKAKGWYTKY
ncbi:transposase [Ascosphaera apis ARSEF 7405]|uniref:Transposase n=1 Tax=Ascosphaera apis ARSEF 7405 TaxID=392613 RepID=A0A167W6F6_9EURO|nr:transposase [Ascosphaera apis ARSEF 7405]